MEFNNREEIFKAIDEKLGESPDFIFDLVEFVDDLRDTIKSSPVYPIKVIREDASVLFEKSESFKGV